MSFPFVMGQEAAGKLVAVHPSVRDPQLKLGLRVAAYVGGCYSEYVKVSAEKVAVSSFFAPEQGSLRQRRRSPNSSSLQFSSRLAPLFIASDPPSRSQDE